MTTKLSEAIDHVEHCTSRAVYHDDLNAADVKDVLKAAKVVEMLERLPKGWGVHAVSGGRGYAVCCGINLASEKPICVEAKTLSEALRAAHEKIEGVE